MMGGGHAPFNVVKKSTAMSDDPSRENAPRPAGELTPAAQRALAEAEARRQAYDAAEKALPPEMGGRGGRDPARYGDWEVKGRASDF